MKRETIFSDCRRYRYTLWRDWGDVRAKLLFDPHWDYYPGKPDQFVQFIGLNPSTADERQDDPTIRRCVGYAKAWGFGALCMTNLFALRATDPKLMLEHETPVGILNIHWLVEVAKEAALVICAWGVHGGHIGQAETVLQQLDRAGLRAKLHCLKKTKEGIPGHPLYLRRELQPQPLFEKIPGFHEV